MHLRFLAGELGSIPIAAGFSHHGSRCPSPSVVAVSDRLLIASSYASIAEIHADVAEEALDDAVVAHERIAWEADHTEVVANEALEAARKASDLALLISSGAAFLERDLDVHRIAARAVGFADPAAATIRAIEAAVPELSAAIAEAKSAADDVDSSAESVSESGAAREANDAAQRASAEAALAVEAAAETASAAERVVSEAEARARQLASIAKARWRSAGAAEERLAELQQPVTGSQAWFARRRATARAEEAEHSSMKAAVSASFEQAAADRGAERLSELRDQANELIAKASAAAVRASHAVARAHDSAARTARAEERVLSAAERATKSASSASDRAKEAAKALDEIPEFLDPALWLQRQSLRSEVDPEFVMWSEEA